MQTSTHTPSTPCHPNQCTIHSIHKRHDLQFGNSSTILAMAKKGIITATKNNNTLMANTKNHTEIHSRTAALIIPITSDRADRIILDRCVVQVIDLLAVTPTGFDATLVKDTTRFFEVRHPRCLDTKIS